MLRILPPRTLVLALLAVLHLPYFPCWAQGGADKNALAGRVIAAAESTLTEAQVADLFAPAIRLEGRSGLLTLGKDTAGWGPEHAVWQRVVAEYDADWSTQINRITGMAASDAAPRIAAQQRLQLANRFSEAELLELEKLFSSYPGLRALQRTLPLTLEAMGVVAMERRTDLFGKAEIDSARQRVRAAVDRIDQAALQRDTEALKGLMQHTLVQRYSAAMQAILSEGFGRFKLGAVTDAQKMAFAQFRALWRVRIAAELSKG